MKTQNIAFLIGGAVLGWYLCTNKRKETERALKLAREEIKLLGKNLEAMVSENNRLSSLAVTEDVNNNDLGV